MTNPARALAQQAAPLMAWPRPCIGVIGNVRSHVVGASLSVGLLLSVSTSVFLSPPMLVAWAMILLAVLVSQRQHPSLAVLASMTVLVVSYCVASLGAAMSGASAVTLAVTMSIGVAAAAAFIRRNATVDRWLLAAGVVHAVAIIIDALVFGMTRADGLMFNPNPAAGLLAILTPLAMRSRSRWWIAILFLAAIPLTGSRLASLAVGGVVVAMLITRSISIRHAVLLAIPGLAFVGLSWDKVYSAYDRGTHAVGVSRVIEDIQVRTQVDSRPSLMPQGGAVSSRGLHTVPMRIAVEGGILAALAWVAVTAYALLKRRLSPTWWMLAVVVGLSSMDYYVWLAQLAPLWWLLIGAQLMRGDKTDDETMAR